MNTKITKNTNAYRMRHIKEFSFRKKKILVWLDDPVFITTYIFVYTILSLKIAIPRRIHMTEIKSIRLET